MDSSFHSYLFEDLPVQVAEPSSPLEDYTPVSPLPELIIEREPAKTLDEPKEFYEKLARKIRRMYNRDFFANTSDESYSSSASFKRRKISTESDGERTSSELIDANRSRNRPEIDHNISSEILRRRKDTVSIRSLSQHDSLTSEKNLSGHPYFLPIKIGPIQSLEASVASSREEEDANESPGSRKSLTKSTLNDQTSVANVEEPSQEVVLAGQVDEPSSPLEDYTPVSPLPELIIEREPAKTLDESKEFYEKLARKIRQMYKRDFFANTSDESYSSSASFKRRKISTESDGERTSSELIDANRSRNRPEIDHNISSEILRRRKDTVSIQPLSQYDSLTSEKYLSGHPYFLPIKIEPMQTLEASVSSSRDEEDANESPASQKSLIKSTLNDQISVANVKESSHEQVQLTKVYSFDTYQSNSPLSELVIEKEPVKTLDEPKKYYEKFAKKFRQMYKKDFLNDDRNDSRSSPSSSIKRQKMSTESNDAQSSSGGQSIDASISRSKSSNIMTEILQCKATNSNMRIRMHSLEASVPSHGEEEEINDSPAKQTSRSIVEEPDDARSSSGSLLIAPRHCKETVSVQPLLQRDVSSIDDAYTQIVKDIRDVSTQKVGDIRNTPNQIVRYDRNKFTQAFRNVRNVSTLTVRDVKDAYHQITGDVRDAFTQTMRDVRGTSTQTVIDVREASTQTIRDVRDTSTQTVIDVRDVSTQTVRDVKDASTQSMRNVRNVFTQTKTDVKHVSTQTVKDVRDASTQTMRDVRDTSTQTVIDLRDVSTQTGRDVKDASTRTVRNVINVFTQRLM